MIEKVKIWREVKISNLNLYFDFFLNFLTFYPNFFHNFEYPTQHFDFQTQNLNFNLKLSACCPNILTFNRRISTF